MKFKGKLIGFEPNYIDGKTTIVIETNEIDRLINEYEKLKKCKNLSIQIEQHNGKRSLKANSYCWKLINEIANVNRTSKDEVYKEMLKRYGQSDIVAVLSKIDVSMFFKYYEKIGKSISNGEEYNHYQVFRGSSEYDKREMAILIDGVVSECKELDIETLPPEELKSLKESWC